jgi:predicted transposase/invertase (TIGR01784 family)
VGSTTTATTATPHDALFKAGFEAPEHAAGLFREVLPAAIVEALDWSTIRRENGSFIDPNLNPSHSDLLFSVCLASAPDVKVLLYLLLEHQSLTHKDMCLRVLGYEVRAWELYRKQHSGPLPIVIPVVISHDPKGWTAPTCFHAMFDPALNTVPELAKFVPSFEIRVEDLIEIDDEGLRRWQLETLAMLTIRMLRDGRDWERLLRSLPEWAELVRQLMRTPEGQRGFEQMLRYVFLVAGEVQFDDFCVTLREQLPETEQVTMTMAEQLLAKGEAKGRAQGRAQGRVEGRVLTLSKQMALKFGVISTEHAARIAAATEQQLDVYAERILSAPTPEAVFGDG